MILDDDKNQTRQDGQNDDVNEDEVDSLNEYMYVNVGEYRDDNLEGFREESNDNHTDIEEENEPGKDIIPEPPPRPPPYRPHRPPIKLSFLGTTSFKQRTSQKVYFRNGFLSYWNDRSVFRYSMSNSCIYGQIPGMEFRDFRKIIELRNRV